jgi:hypothetical protein
MCHIDGHHKLIRYELITHMMALQRLFIPRIQQEIDQHDECDYVNIDDVIDDEVDDNHVIVNPIVCPLIPNQLECFIHHIHPLSLATPILSLKDSYYTALTALINIAEMDL